MSNRLLSIITQLPLSSGELQEIEYFASTVFTVMTLYHVVTIFSTILLLSFAICSRSRSGPDNDRAPLPYQLWGGYREKKAIAPGSDISPNYCGAGILPAIVPGSDISPNYCGAGILPALLSHIKFGEDNETRTHRVKIKCKSIYNTTGNARLSVIMI